MHWASTVRAGGRHFAAVEITGLQQQTYYRYTVDLAPLPVHGEIPVDPGGHRRGLPRAQCAGRQSDGASS